MVVGLPEILDASGPWVAKILVTHRPHVIPTSPRAPDPSTQPIRIINVPRAPTTPTVGAVPETDVASGAFVRPQLRPGDRIPCNVRNRRSGSRRTGLGAGLGWCEKSE